MTKVKVKAKGDREFVITRRFQAPRELVFDAMTKPALIKKWLNGPPGWSMTACKVDLRVGGKFRYVWKNQSGQGMALGGVYKEIKRPERLVNTELFDDPWYEGDALSTTVLTEKNGVTLMTITARYESKKVRDGILASPMEGGLEFSYQQLEELVTAQEKKARPGNALYTGISEPGTVDAYMKQMKHPLHNVGTELRRIILKADKRIGEGIFWNAPTFYFTGEMEPFDPKTYKRYIVGFNFFKQDTLRLIFLRGAEVKKHGGLLEGDYTDGRRLMLFRSLAKVKKNEKALTAIIKELIKKI
ncbi:MAG: SRPBCC domain-containing protein [Flavobacteriales bacterium]|nr:SRPBCC domain-containing protein [Flavobacteriales bacterium]